MKQISIDLHHAIAAAKQAGNSIKKTYGKTKKTRRKGHNNYVTDVDIAAEKLIIHSLQKTQYSVLGEETGEKDTQSRKKWIIDPIDGTSNFIRGIPFFAVSIALIEDNTKLILGVVYNPITDECYWAERNYGAYLNGEKIHVSNLNKFDGSIILIEHNRTIQGRKDYLYASKKLLLNNGPVILRYGSTALMLCYLAKGSAEAFLSSGDQIYDYAAGLIIAKEAGAYISDWNGKPWNNENAYVLAVIPPVRDKVLKRIANIQNEKMSRIKNGSV